MKIQLKAKLLINNSKYKKRTTFSKEIIKAFNIISQKHERISVADIKVDNKKYLFMIFNCKYGEDIEEYFKQYLSIAKDNINTLYYEYVEQWEYINNEQRSKGHKKEYRYLIIDEDISIITDFDEINNIIDSNNKAIEKLQLLYNTKIITMEKSYNNKIERMIKEWNNNKKLYADKIMEIKDEDGMNISTSLYNQILNIIYNS